MTGPASSPVEAGDRRGRRDVWVRRMWRGRGGVLGSVLSLLLLPLSGAYRLVTAARSLAYGLGVATVHEPEIPVVSVGNLSVGGTGKTPVTRWVVERLRAGGMRPSIVMRGYGADEVELHGRWAPDVPVVADTDRVAAVGEASRAGADVAVVDDGFQHRRLGRHLDVVLLAAEERFPGPVLPRGPYREPPRALDRADVIMITRKSAPASTADAVEEEIRARGVRRPIVRIHLAPDRVTTLAAWACADSGHPGEPEVDRPGNQGPFRVVSGVADPDSVVAAARALGLDVSDRADFPDHHPFSAEEIARLRGGPYPLLVTEKDAIKLRTHIPAARDVFVLEQRLVIERGEDVMSSLLDRIRSGEPA